MTKKNNQWSSNISLETDGSAIPLAASLVSEEVHVDVDGEKITVQLSGYSASDLRAKFNSTVRSLMAASEALTSIREEV